jgi:flagellar biogenesis protein FliO
VRQDSDPITRRSRIALATLLIVLGACRSSDARQTTGRGPVDASTDARLIARSDATADSASARRADISSGSQTDALPIRRDAADPNSTQVAAKQPQGTSGLDLARLMAAMGIVLALILLARWGAQKLMPGTRPNAPGPISVVSRTVIGPRQQLLLIRVGGKLLLVSDSAGTMSRLTEITDADEIAILLGSISRPTTDLEQESDPDELPAPNRGFGKWFGRARETFATTDANDPADAQADTQAGEPADGRASGHANDPVGPASGRRLAQVSPAQRGRIDLTVDDSPPTEPPSQQVAGDIQQLLERIRRVSEQVKAGRSS